MRDACVSSAHGARSVSHLCMQYGSRGHAAGTDQDHLQARFHLFKAPAVLDRAHMSSFVTAALQNAQLQAWLATLQHLRIRGATYAAFAGHDQSLHRLHVRHQACRLVSRLARLQTAQNHSFAQPGRFAAKCRPRRGCKNKFPARHLLQKRAARLPLSGLLSPASLLAVCQLPSVNARHTMLSPSSRWCRACVTGHCSACWTRRSGWLSGSRQPLASSSGPQKPAPACLAWCV